MILNGEVAPSSYLAEASLVDLLAMSRTPIREALHRLELEGLLRRVPRHGYMVVPLSTQGLANLYAVRAALEGLAAELAAQRLTRVNLARLEDLYEAMEAACIADRDADLATLNRDFHETIAIASENNYLREILDNIKGIFERYRSTAISNMDRRSLAHQEHGELIGALRARDPDRSRRIAEAHVYRAMEANVDTRDL